MIAYWREWFARNPGARFEAEEIIVSGDRAVVRWVYRKIRDGQPPPRKEIYLTPVVIDKNNLDRAEAKD